MTKPSDYIWIKRWGKFLGSFDYYIENEQRRALADDAPLDAIHKRDFGDGSWATMRDIGNHSTRAYFEHNFAECREEGFWNDDA